MTPTLPISVVVPCHNAAHYVSSTLRSVLSQQGFDLDVIVVDDGSTDGSADLVAKAFPSVTLLRQPNRGVAAARNAGISQARHDWLAFVDADDIWLPDKLRTQWTVLQSARGARMTYTAWQVWSSTDPEPSPQYLEQLGRLAADESRWRGPSGWIYPQLLLDCVVWTSTVVVHRSVFDEVGTFDPTLTIGEDWDLWLRASRVTPILRACAPLALYRMHPANITKRAPDRNYKEEVIARALRRWGYRSPDGARASKSAVRRSLARSWSDIAGAQLLAGNVENARRAAGSALLADPLQLTGWKLFTKSVLRSLAGRGSKAA